MKRCFSILIFFFLICINADNILSSSYITIPFKTENLSDDFITSKYDINLHTYMEIGQPKQKIKIYFRDELFSFFIINKDTTYEDQIKEPKIQNVNINKNIYNLYDNELSSTYRNISKYQNFFIDIYYRKGFLSTETFYFNQNNNKLNRFDDIDFVLANKIKTNRTLISGSIGLLVDEYFLEGAQSFARMLVKKNVISFCLWSKVYLNDNSGMFLFGDFPHVLHNDKYYKEQYVETDIKLNPYKQKWNLDFNEIFFKIKNNEYLDDNNNNDIYNYYYLNITLYGELKHNLGLIIGTVEYQNLIEEKYFNIYIKKNICFKKKILINDFNEEKINYTYYYCPNDKLFDKNNFPTLYLRQRDLKYIFELNNDDLFILHNNIWYFMIIFEGEEISNPIHKWMFGEPLLKKYQFIFDPINYKIGFYNPEISIFNKIKNKDNEKDEYQNFQQIGFYILIVIIVLAILFLLCYLFIKRCFINKNDSQPYIELKNLPIDKYRGYSNKNL